MDLKKIVDYLFELGQLRRIKHEGWRVIGVDNPESVADHSADDILFSHITDPLRG